MRMPKTSETATEVNNSLYDRKFFLMVEGEASFHEHVHFWQHTGTTAGAFQLIGYHIALKAMQQALHLLHKRGITKFPITPDLINLLPEHSERNVLESALRYAKIVERYELASKWTTLQSTEGATRSLKYGFPRSAQKTPLLLFGIPKAYPLGIQAITEFHNLVLSKLQDSESGSVPGLVETNFLKKLHKAFGESEQSYRIAAYLCDWALMGANHTVTKRSSERHPGTRFLAGLKILKELDKNDLARLSQDYPAFGNYLATKLGWLSPDMVVDQFKYFMGLAESGIKNKNDSIRSRNTYRIIRRLLKRSYQIRLNVPDAFALPNEHFHLLVDRLPPLVKKVNGKLSFASPDIKTWYLPYLSNATMLLQAFSDSTVIRCCYQYHGITSDCPELSQNTESNNRCYIHPNEEGYKYIDCKFRKFWKEWHLTPLKSIDWASR